MARPQVSMVKRQREQAKRERKEKKAERKDQRKRDSAAASESGTASEIAAPEDLD